METIPDSIHMAMEAPTTMARSMAAASTGAPANADAIQAETKKKPMPTPSIQKFKNDESCKWVKDAMMIP